MLRRLSARAPILGIDTTRGLLLGIAGNTIQMLGTYWDLWWHINIGRESFWIPPHEAVLVGWAIVVFGTGLGFLADRERQYHERRGLPRITLGYLLVGAGLICMLVAAYLDDIRHRTSRLPDMIITPTHFFLFASGFTVGLGIMLGLARELNLKGVWPKQDGGRLYPLRETTKEEVGLLVQFADWIMILTLLSWDITDKPLSTGNWMAALLSTGIYTLVLVTALSTIRRFGSATAVALIFSLMRIPFQWASFYYPFLIISAVFLDVIALKFNLTRSLVKTSLVAAFLMGPLLQSLYFMYAVVLRGFVWTLQFEVIVVAVTLTAGVAMGLAARSLSSIVRSIRY
jgi:hypothetical protein